jgi:ATP-binding cassette subfamily B (MDR/TAP) protein 1
MFVQGFWYGGYLVLKGSLAPGAVVLVFWAALSAVNSLQIMSPQFIVLEKGKVASSEIAMLCSSPQRKQLEDVPETNKVGDIEIKNVHPIGSV